MFLYQVDYLDHRRENTEDEERINADMWYQTNKKTSGGGDRGAWIRVQLWMEDMITTLTSKNYSMWGPDQIRAAPTNHFLSEITKENSLETDILKTRFDKWQKYTYMAKLSISTDTVSFVTQPQTST